MDGVTPVHINFEKRNGYIEDNNGLTLIPADETKIKTNNETWSEI